MADFQNDILSIDLIDGIAQITLKMERANVINEGFLSGFEAGVDAVDGMGVRGMVLTSAHRDFCVGADLNMIYKERDPAKIMQATTAFHRLHRRMEKGVPVVCALNGSALGGGYELAMACHHIVAINTPTLKVGLPEVMLGVIPGGGGTQRLSRRLGLQGAMELITQGTLLRARAAQGKGLIDALVDDPASLLAAARAWIDENPKAKQPWDNKGFRWPGARPGSTDARNLFLAASAMAYKKTAGAFPAVEHAISAIQEGSLVAFDASLAVEARHFAGLVVSDQAKDMIRTLFFHKQAADRQSGLPKAPEHGFQKVVVLGAGMMGGGIGFLCAKAGMQVVLKDIHEEAVTAGLAHVDAQLKRLKHLDDTGRSALRARITGSVFNEACAGADLVIEAVVEDKRVKHAVLAELESLLAPNAVWASNTSALPISDLAEPAASPERFVGLHFFSPVEKMPLLEVIAGAKTNEATLGRALALGRALGKTCILVNDGYGFYTTSVFSSYILEGAEMVAEGIDPRLVEWGARSAGMVVGPLQVFDEVTLSLGHHAITQGAEYVGDWLLELRGVRMLFDMVEAGRTGRAAGAGFYNYEEGKRQGLWSGLPGLETPTSVDVTNIGERLILAQVAAVGRCLDAGILREPRDAEIGAVFGVGFAPNTGGPLAWVDRQGAGVVVAKLEALSKVYGPRFAPAQRYRDQAEKSERFFD